MQGTSLARSACSVQQHAAMGMSMQSDAKPAHELPLLYQAPMHTICEGSKAKSRQNARSACSASRHGTKEVGQKDSSCTAWPS